MAALFDRYLAVDWSAASAPKRGVDSIWIATARRDGVAIAENPPTRAAAARLLHRAVEEAEGGERTLVAVDASLGFPAGTARALGLGRGGWEACWELVAELVHDDDRNRNNRFHAAALLNARIGSAPGPFWGRPVSTATPRKVCDALPRTKPSTTVLPEWRHVEEVLRASGRRPFSAWQLLGAGSVGSQTLTVLPVLHALRTAHLARLAVWPFTTGLRAPPTTAGAVVVAEVWPSLLTSTTPDGRVRDEHQVRTVVEELARRDRTGELHAWFAPDVARERRATVVGEEGWVLGVPGTLGATRPAS